MQTDKELLEEISKKISEYEKPLTTRFAGSELERVSHCLSYYRQIAENSIRQTKSFAEDVKTMFKALEIVVEGISSDGMNHGQKRVIANHVITILRSNVDKLNRMEYDYSIQTFESFDFFRSQTPEKRLYEKNQEMERKMQEAKNIIDRLRGMFPDAVKQVEQDLSF